MIKVSPPYEEILDKSKKLESSICLIDHIGGFDANKSNKILSLLDQSFECNSVSWHGILDKTITSMYPNITIRFDADLQNRLNLRHFHDYRCHPENTFRNFLCSFNGSIHISRKLLVAILHRMGWFDQDTCSKNLRFTLTSLDGNLSDYLDPVRHRFCRPFFIGPSSAVFFDAIYSFGHVRCNHANNIYNLETKLTRSFVHIVSETLATSYYPFVTEKFLYSVVTRGLFVAYAQPGWHDHVQRYYGFLKYDKIFDYRFDSIENPVERLVELISMISKFSRLSSDDWHDLYEMQIDTIEYNYDHYFSGRYLEKLKHNES